jgi:hypothetical protein
MTRDIRLGDDIDDFCVRCKRVMNHAVVSVLNNAPAKVRCRTCHSDHDFRHEQPPPPKIDPRKAALFNEVLKKVDPDAAPVELEPVELGPGDLEAAADDTAVDEVAPEDAVEGVAAEVVAAPEPVAKPKGRGRAKKS